MDRLIQGDHRRQCKGHRGLAEDHHQLNQAHLDWAPGLRRKLLMVLMGHLVRATKAVDGDQEDSGRNGGARRLPGAGKGVPPLQSIILPATLVVPLLPACTELLHRDRLKDRLVALLI